MHQTLKQLPMRVGLLSALALCTADCLAQAPGTTTATVSNGTPTFAAAAGNNAPFFNTGAGMDKLPTFSGMTSNDGQHTSLPPLGNLQDTSLPHINGLQQGIPMSREPVRSFHLTTAGVTVPLVLIGIGAAGLSTNSLIYKLNHNTAHEIREDYPRFHTSLDDYLKFAPAVATVGLEAVGVQGRHTAAQTAVISAISLSLAFGSTEVVKRITKETRPDGSDNLSFPSGHTAAAFASAELMRLEFKDTHPVLAWSGYMAAVATGAMRMLKQRHFTGDVAAGAGFGILSTEAAYLVYPVVQRVFSPKRDAAPKMTLLPQYNTQWKTAGLAFSYHF